jgi:hypothetical protein
MPCALSHVVVLTDDLDATIRFVRDVAVAADAARDAGFEVRGPLTGTGAGEHGATIAEIVARGVPFELLQF